MLTTDQKGAIAETAIVHAATKAGIGVLKPMTEGGSYDLVFDLGSRFVRVQCKWVGRRGDVVAIRCYSSRRSRDGFRRRFYTHADVDAIAAYCAELNRSFFLPISVISGRVEVSLRLRSTRNGQKLRVTWADDIEFSRVDWESIAGP